MTIASIRPVPRWFRAAALLAIAWNLFGVAMYLSAVGLFGEIAVHDEAERSAAASIPVWVMGAFAIGTWSGLIGSIGLLLRRAWARPLLILSLIGLLMLEGWILFLSGAVAVFGLAVPILVIIGSVLLAWLAIRAHSKAWLS